MALVVIILVFLPIFLFFLLQRKNKIKTSRLPPGPKGLPIIGNLHQFDSLKPHHYFFKLSRKYGPLVSCYLGFVPILIVSSAEMAKQVLQIQDLQFCNRPNWLGMQVLSYNFLALAFSSYNDYWREMRKIFAIHLFNSNRVQQFHPIREDEVFRMIDKISKSADSDKANVNLSEIMMLLTSNNICRVAFGKRYEDEGSERSRFQALLNESQALFVYFFFSDYFPFMYWLDKLTGRIRRLENNFRECDKFYQELIDEHLDPQRVVTDEQEDIIDVLLQLRRDHGCNYDLTLDHIKALLVDVFVAGTDTSAATVVWAMTYLMKNPRVMKKAQEEIRATIGNRSFINEDDIQKLVYLKAVVKEVLRLQPIAPLLIPRQTYEKCFIGEYEIPAKTIVFVNAMAIGRDPEAWDNPEEFYPERFTGSSIDLKGQHFELIPFGAGRRICPGMHMGMAVVELSLANLLYRFDWEMPVGMKEEDLDFECLPGIAMHKKNPLLLMAKKYI
ncbi:putative Cytochrome P450 [Melia azedarach]|uniref:Cytochrome P450 n=1 Tax=Melia azedarach TaxID=155640 RepID=A0ACC1YM76_MELAZ|nr:putative Cytochrome P450 [Melia azedarach]